MRLASQRLTADCRGLACPPPPTVTEPPAGSDTRFAASRSAPSTNLLRPSSPPRSASTPSSASAARRNRCMRAIPGGLNERPQWTSTAAVTGTPPTDEDVPSFQAPPRLPWCRRLLRPSGLDHRHCSTDHPTARGRRRCRAPARGRSDSPGSGQCRPSRHLAPRSTRESSTMMPSGRASGVMNTRTYSVEKVRST